MPGLPGLSGSPGLPPGVAPGPALRRRQLVLGAAAGALMALRPASVQAAPAVPAVPAVQSLQSAGEETDPVIETVQLAGARLEVQFAPGFDDRLQQQALAWVRRSALAVAAYFGRFPVTEVVLLLVPVDGAGVLAGTTFGEPDLRVRLRLGRSTTQAQFADDWILVHEMVHLAVPRVPRAQNWLHEGLATYVESVARGRAGLMPAATVWHQWAKVMPQGQPRSGDAGLDHTPTWGRTYWGGAIFCLRADVQMLTRSAGRAGLRQGLQGVLAAGGHFGVAWSADRILATADAAVGQTTLTDLYRQLKDSPQPTDLDALWRSLGVADDGFDDAAPLAAVRRAILS